jgi:VHL beta domain
MNDRLPTDPSTFARALLDAARADAPSAAAKAHARGAVLAAATAPVLPVGAWVGGGALVALAAAAAVAVAVRATPPKPAATIPTIVAEAPSRAPAPSPRRTSPAALAAAREPKSCDAVRLPDEPPTVCSTPGRVEPLELVNTCAETVDVFWVDYQCRETFAGRVAPGESFEQRTFDTHPWRVRDHATHRLIKEWVGPRMADPPEGPIELPDVVIDDRSRAPDLPPTMCSRASHEARLRFVNNRTRGVSVVFWVDRDCHESLYGRLEPGGIFEQKTYEAHPWRVRDEQGVLLVDLVPDAPDETVYVTLP